MKSEKLVYDRFAVLFSVAIVWLYAYFLTIGGAYRHAPPKTQVHCRTDRSGLVGGAPWYISYHFDAKIVFECNRQSKGTEDENFFLTNTDCRIRIPYPFQWGAPTFDAGEVFAMMAASFVALVEVY